MTTLADLRCIIRRLRRIIRRLRRGNAELTELAAEQQAELEAQRAEIDQLKGSDRQPLYPEPGRTAIKCDEWPYDNEEQ